MRANCFPGTLLFSADVEPYQLVQLKNGAFSVRSMADQETFHPVVGPQAEAEALYVKQLGLVHRLTENNRPFVVWDVGLGAAANPLTFLTSAKTVDQEVVIESFDHKTGPLAFALERATELSYVEPYRAPLKELLEEHEVKFSIERLRIHWRLHLGDFPSLLKGPMAQNLPKPDAIFYDAYSPQKNPSMWTLEVFSDLFRLLDPQRPCAMPTYSRSTMLRVTLLLAGFFVGVGHATGEKEETTIAANCLQRIDEPLGDSWLGRVRRSRSAEPLTSPIYRQSPLLAETWAKLREHPQFT